MKVLLHACCGPCAIYPITTLRENGYDVTTHFYNPNIHPYREFKKRYETLQQYCSMLSLPLIADNSYGLTEFIRNVVFNEEKKCSICYTTRLECVAKTAAKNGFSGFSTTLLYSKYQQHDLLIKTCETFSKEYGVSFIYKDFREGWQEGIDKSIELGMYRQPYCGCIYSEQERYDKSLRSK